LKNSHLQGWIDRKLGRDALTISFGATAESEHSKHAGPRWEYGKVAIQAEPSSDFRFTSKVIWPCAHFKMYEEMVLDGVLDVLICRSANPILGVSVTLLEIGWHEVNSAPMFYYFAARTAMQKILDKPEIVSIVR